MKMTKKKIATSIISIITLLASTAGLISVGFSSWVISKNDTSTTEGEMATEAVVYLTGVEITSVSSFTYSSYSFGNNSSFYETGTISYSISVTPYNLDVISKTYLQTDNGLTLYARFSSLLEVFDKENESFTMFNGVSSIGNPALSNISNCVASSNSKDIFFSFVIPKMTNEQLNSGQNVSYTYNLTFTFNNKLLVKNYGVDGDNNPITLMDNKFTLYLGRESF